MTQEPKPRPACHRFYVPLAIPTPMLDPLTGKPKRDIANPNQLHMEVRPQVANSECIGERCTLWNKGRSECYDVTQARALETIANNYAAPQGS